METIVVKVDSSSLLTPERIDKLAERILKHRNNGKNTIVVVPSIELLEGKLLPYSSIFTERIADRESHALKAINTQVASSLLAIVLEKKGCKAVSLSGWQAGIEAVKSNGNILIEQIHHDFLLERIHNGK